MISVRRGTTFDLLVELKNELGEIYKLQTGETLVLGVKTNVNSNEYVITKAVTSAEYSEALGGYAFNLVIDDTKDLPFGKYVYDVGLKSGDNFYIVCPCDTFEIADTVTERSAV